VINKLFIVPIVMQLVIACSNAGGTTTASSSAISFCSLSSASSIGSSELKAIESYKQDYTEKSPLKIAAAISTTTINFCSASAVRYNTETFSSVTVSNNITYGSNTNQDGSSQTLQLDLYSPSGDTESSRPLVVFAHGGGFVGGNKDQGQEFAQYLAKAGYVVASIQYRIVDANTQAAIAAGAKVMSTVVKQALVDAVHDMKASILFLVNNASNYGIDKSKIFIAGYSAGALTSLHTAYLSSTSELAGESSMVSYIDANGGLLGDTATTSSASCTIRGVLNMAGSVINTGIISANEPPLLSVHGTSDATVPYTSGNTDNTGVTTYGSSPIDTAAATAGVTSNVFAINGAGHDVFADGVEATGCDNCQEMAREFFYCNLN
jgi:para-nitrobenzyl esterase